VPVLVLRFSVSAKLAEIRRAWKYPDLHQLDLLHVREEKASGN
jgi:hypothetical protein